MLHYWSNFTAQWLGRTKVWERYRIKCALKESISMGYWEGMGGVRLVLTVGQSGTIAPVQVTCVGW